MSGARIRCQARGPQSGCLYGPTPSRSSGGDPGPLAPPPPSCHLLPPVCVESSAPSYEAPEMAFRALGESETSPRTQNRKRCRHLRGTSPVTRSGSRGPRLAPLGHHAAALPGCHCSLGASNLESFPQPLSSLGFRLPGYKGDQPSKEQMPAAQHSGSPSSRTWVPTRGCQGHFPGTQALGRFQAQHPARPSCCQSSSPSLVCTQSRLTERRPGLVTDTMGSAPEESTQGAA